MVSDPGDAAMVLIKIDTGAQGMSILHWCYPGTDSVVIQVVIAGASAEQESEEGENRNNSVHDHLMD